MTLPADIRLAIRQRANFACEYCGVAEIDVGGELTIDHFHPRSQGGPDDITNLVYCCHRCNEYKASYWPTSGDAPQLWNPRTSPFDQHFLELADGTLYPRTETGTFTLRRLRLNRNPLVAYRRRRTEQTEQQEMLLRYHGLVASLNQVVRQQAALLQEQQALLEQQRALLRLLLPTSDEPEA